MNGAGGLSSEHVRLSRWDSGFSHEEFVCLQADPTGALPKRVARTGADDRGCEIRVVRVNETPVAIHVLRTDDHDRTAVTEILLMVAESRMAKGSYEAVIWTD
jgi:hypothetical protein